MTLATRLAGRRLNDLSDRELGALGTDSALSGQEQGLVLEALRRRVATQDDPATRIVVVGFDISFGARVVELLKWGLAAIPATIVLAIVAAVLMAFLAPLSRGMR